MEAFDRVPKRKIWENLEKSVVSISEIEISIEDTGI